MVGRRAVGSRRPSIGIALGFHRNHIGRALAALVDKGLLTATRRFSNSTIHRPTMAELSTISICNKTVQMDAPKRCTNRKEEQEEVWAQDTSTLMVLSKEGGSAIVDDAESCGSPAARQWASFARCVGGKGPQRWAKG